MFEYLGCVNETAQAIASAASMQSMYTSALYRQVKANPGSAVPFYLMQEALSIIEEIKELQDGWAGEDSIAPTRKTLNMVLAAVQHIYIVAPFADISPMPNGTIAFDWNTEAGTANLEIGENRFSFYLETSAGFHPLSGTSESIPSELGVLIRQSLFGSVLAESTPATSYISSPLAPRLEYA